MDIDEALQMEEEMMLEMLDKDTQKENLENSVITTKRKEHVINLSPQPKRARLMNKFYELGLEYKALGIVTIPVRKYKIPIPKGWQNFTDMPSHDTWNGCHGIGIVCGPQSNLTVLDLDKVQVGNDKVDGVDFMDQLISQYGPMMDCPVVVSPSGGKHLYFQYEDSLGCSVGIKAWSSLDRLQSRLPADLKITIDVRSTRGQVIGATTPYTTKAREKKHFKGFYRFDVEGKQKWNTCMKNRPKMPMQVRQLFTHDLVYERTTNKIAFYEQKIRGHSQTALNTETKASNECKQIPGSLSYDTRNVSNTKVTKQMLSEAKKSMKKTVEIILTFLNGEYLSSYDQWRKIVFSVKHAAVAYNVNLFDIVHEWTKKSCHYDHSNGRAYVLTKYNEDPSSESYTINTLWTCLKETAPDKYWQIYNARYTKTYVANDYLTFLGQNGGRILQYDVDEYLSSAYVIIRNRWYTRIKDNGQLEWIASKTEPFQELLSSKKLSYMVDGKTYTFAQRIVYLRGKSRIATYEKVDFIPFLKQEIIKKGTLNLFTGFAWAHPQVLTSFSENLTFMIDHVKYQLCNGNEKVFNQLMNWLAHLVQHPEQKTGVCIGMRSKQGTGKGLFWESFMSSVIGRRFVHTLNNLKALTSKFNERAKGKLLCILDEIGNGKEEHFNQLKNILTSPEMYIEPKGKEAYRVSDFCRYVITSNTPWFCRVANDDRRYFIIQCADPKSPDYYNKLSHIAKHDTQTAKDFFNMLAHYNITKPVTYVPNTEVRSELKWNNKENVPLKYIKDIIEGEYKTTLVHFNQRKQRYEVHTSDFYQDFQLYCSQTGEHDVLPKRTFTSILKNVGIQRVAYSFKIANSTNNKGYRFTKKDITNVFRTVFKEPKFTFTS